jgi:hypothetical protein
MAALDFSTRTNPRPAAEHDYLALLEAAFDQSLTNASRA